MLILTIIKVLFLSLTQYINNSNKNTYKLKNGRELVERQQQQQQRRR